MSNRPRVSPEIITRVLGSQNIQKDVVPISEIVKNAYESNATEITIDLSDTERIIIADNGDGLDKYGLLRAWTTIGDSLKVDSEGALGGKGIGRFTLFRLADSIKVFTKTSQCTDAHSILIDKNEIETYDDYADVIFDLKVESHTFFEKNKSGLIYELSEIKPIQYKQIYIEIVSLLEPFKDKPLEINIIYPKSEKLKGNIGDKYYLNYLVPDEVINYAPFEINAVFDEGKFKSINFKVKNIYKDDYLIDTKDFTSEEKKSILDIVNKAVIRNSQDKDEGVDVPLTLYEDLGTIQFQIYNFFLDTKKIHTKERNIVNEFLEAYQGVNIYRNGFKIFGHGNNDWLKLAEERLKRAADNIDNKLTFGYVSLEDQTKNILIETSSREGFAQEGQYYNALIVITNALIRYFGKEVRAKYSSLLIGKPVRRKREKSTVKIVSLGTSDVGTSDVGTSDVGTSDVGTSDVDASGVGTPGVGTLGVGTSDEGALETENIRGRNHNPQNRKRAISTFSVNIKDPQLAKIYKELQNLDIGVYPLACAILSRIIIENVCVLYMEKKHQKKHGTYRIRKGALISDVMDSTKDLPILDSNKRLAGARKAFQKDMNRENVLSFEVLGLSAHGAYYPNEREIKNSWDNIQEFIEFLIEESSL